MVKMKGHTGTCTKEEIRAKTDGRLNEVLGELRRDQTDLVRAKYIHIVGGENQKIVQQAEKELNNAEEALTRLRRSLSIAMLREAGDSLAAFGQQANEVVAVAGVEEATGPSAFWRSPIDCRRSEGSGKLLAPVMMSI
ncbi:MAG: hypothetical protein IPO15_15255 [Anaerolineae bacterium]|uniref:hypothetical protein n=1 Tax=Candidatus Amarolinea dominans TaxID=3140696 RepID=UPI003136FB53|nr:hypothetical protein [Anaerolineae bacterium]